MDWFDLAQERNMWRTLVDAVINLWISQNEGNFLTILRAVSLSGKILSHGVSNILGK
jgi:phenylalanine-4-hydroxylase